jgi:hypothetical protein
VIDYLVEENRVLRKQLRGRRVRLTDGQRRRLAVKGQRFGRQVLRQVATIVTPDTILRWYRRLIAGTFTLLRPGCPMNMRESPPHRPVPVDAVAIVEQIRRAEPSGNVSTTC